MTRPETGPMKFEGDWTGFFIRGDRAFELAFILDKVVDGKEVTTIDKCTLKAFKIFLKATQEPVEKGVRVQLLKKFEKCKK